MRILTISLGCLMLAGCFSPSIPNSAAHVQPQVATQTAATAATTGYRPETDPAYHRLQERSVRDAQLEGLPRPKTTVPVSEPLSSLPAGVDTGVVVPPLPTTSATKLPKVQPMDVASGVAADTRAVFSTTATPVTTNTATMANDVTIANPVQMPNAASVMPQETPVAPAVTPQTEIGRYALANQHPVGTKKYSRGIMSKFKGGRKCKGFTSPDKAQVAFLAQGGPENDPLGLDPDGDGYACAWDPAPYRHAVNG